MQAHIDVSARRFGIEADLVFGFDQLLGFSGINTMHFDIKIDI